MIKRNESGWAFGRLVAEKTRDRLRSVQSTGRGGKKELLKRNAESVGGTPGRLFNR